MKDFALTVLTELPRFGTGVGLHRMAWLTRRLHSPDWLAGLDAIHVTGSNGKGSTAIMVARILEQLDVRSGLYTSPHLVELNERIAVAGTAIDDAELIEINTTNSERGNNTTAARAMERRLLDAGFPGEDVRVLVPADAPTKGNLVARYRGRDAARPAILLLAHIDVVEALQSDWSPDINPFEFIKAVDYGDAGLNPYSQSQTLEEIRRICDEHDVLLIADEVMCGSGRCGTFYTHPQEDILADTVTLAKGIGGGYQPLAAALISEHMASTIHDAGFAHGHTYIGHATVCSAGVAVQDVIDRENLLAN